MIVALAVLAILQPPSKMLDDFTSIASWTVAPAEGVSMRLARDSGAMRIDFDFHGHGGWAIARRRLAIDLPENYAFTFSVKGHSPPNTLQFKMIDSTGANVWWWAHPDMVFSPEWTPVMVPRRRVSFAFGPIGGSEMRPGGPVIHHVAAIEIAIAAGSGGRGSIWIKALAITPIPRPAGPVLVDINDWTIDFRARREIGGVDITWDTTAHRPVRYRVEVSDDDSQWRVVRRVAHARLGHGGHDFVVLPDAIARFVRVWPESGKVRELDQESAAFADSVAGRFAIIARDAPKGAYPRYLHGEQPYWTVFGSRNGTHTGLLDTDGNADFGARTPGIEPFVIDRGRVISWADVHAEASLDSGDRPIPSVTWRANDWSLTVTGYGAHDSLGLQYRVTNTSAHAIAPTLVLAVRPFQVDPPWQSLNVTGGPTPIPTLDPLTLHPSERPTAVGASTFADGDITEYLWGGTFPRQSQVEDPDGYASGAMTFALHLAPGESHDVYLGTRHSDQWSSDLVIEGPPPVDDLARAIRTSIGYILIDHLKPGPRSYDRTWIRDGTLMSDALLRVGDSATVRKFIQYFAPYQYASGRIPCCVDAHGADPVPELDSDGEFIALVSEYTRYTGDSALLRAEWPHILAAVADMDSLRHHDTLGLIPPSISHEGYSAHPEHSVWDDCWAIKGYSDAGYMAQRDTLSAHLNAAIARSGAFVPGAVDIDDYDATSTAIGLSPTECGLPDEQLRRTFTMYDSLFALRLAGRIPAYTPYEFRNAGALLRLGDREHAWPVIAAGVRDLHPAAWYAWPEVVFRDTAAPNVIGDRPHGWVAAEFVRAVLDLFAYESNHDSTLVLGAGVQRAWLTPGVRIAGLHTPFGLLSFHEWDDHGTLRVHVDAGLTPPPGGIVVRVPVGFGDDRVVVRALPADVAFHGH
ncbi:MAG TPA: discoidin domain-containing protein [Gemmatimonadaceae bacterium]|nr:discoidin domain-containing protein [Gemmatimonadaceae bacterium]